MFNPVFQKNILSMKPDWAFLLASFPAKFQLQKHLSPVPLG